MAVNFYSEVHFADNVGIGQTDPQTLLHLTTAMSSSPTTQLYLDVDGSNTNGGGGEIIFNTSASAGSLTSYNAKITGTRASGGTGGDSQLGFWTTLVSSSQNPQERMTITKEGNVGVGNTSPNYKLDVNGTSRVAGTIHMYGAVRNYSGDFSLQNGHQDSDILFKVNDGGTTTTAMMIDGATSNVGIGTTSPGEKLDVAGDIKLSGDIELGHASDTTIARASAGKVTIEGQPIQTKQMSMTHHNFFMNSSSTTADFFVPFNNLNESSNPTNTQYYNRMVAPYDGRIVKVVLHTTAAIGTSCQVLFWVANSVSGVFAPSAAETVTGVNLNTANASATATFSTNSTAEFDEGDVLGVSIIKSSSSTANMQVTVVWEYTV